MGKLLVSGALGNVGGYVAQHAIDLGDFIVAADINPEALNKRYGQRAESVRFDFTDESTFSSALNGVDRVFLMRPPHLGKPKDLKPFIEAMKQHGGIKLVVFLSLIGIEHNPIPPHYRIEKMIEASGIPFCHIRPSFFMQNISGIHAFEIKHFDRIVVPVKKALTSFIDAQDIGEIIAHVLFESHMHINKAYSITGPEAINYETVSRILSEELGRNIQYANPSPAFSKQYWIQVRGIDKGYATVMGLLYMMTRMGTAKRVTHIFEEVLGKKPTDFRTFVKKNRAVWERIT